MDRQECLSYRQLTRTFLKRYTKLNQVQTFYTAVASFHKEPEH